MRDCSVYKEEYKDCKSFRSRFNQYFIFGEYISCDQWRDDYNNCQKFSWLHDKEAAKNLIQSELSRKAARLKAHYDNDTWTKRENPPADWAKPLPAFMEERNKNTYLGLKNEEYKTEQEQKIQQALTGIPAQPNKSSFCTFMWNYSST